MVERLQSAGAEVITAAAPVMDAISPVRSPSSIVALAARPRPDVSRLFAREPPLVVIADTVQDPGNVGALVRVAEAAGATGVIMAGGCADPFGWKALRGSMGSAVRLPLAVCPRVDAAIEAARRHRCRILATTPRAGRSLFEMDLRGPTAVLIGSEGAGLPRRLVDSADAPLTIPMQAPVESLNAAVTAALVVYEARRQRSR